MRIALAGLLITVLSLGGAGCSKESPKGGPGKDVAQQKKETKTVTEPGGTQRKEETTTTEPGANRDATFSIKEPGATRLTQGDSKKVTISIDRGRKFEQPVKLSFKPDAGIMVDPTTATIASKENKVEVAVQAEAKATVGSHSVEVTGTPETGAPTSLKFAVEVKEKK